MKAAPVSIAEAKALFAPLENFPAVIVAVSGGPDSTALLLLAARWRKARRRGPALTAVTVDHGLRPESAAEARAVGKLAASLGVAHRVLRWTGAKPKTGLQEAARDARYRLLATEAKRAHAPAILTAHTHDDQAETVLFRMARGSGLTGLKGMARDRPLADGVVLMRPLLDIPKARLVATVTRAGLVAADDPSNRDPRFARSRLRGLLPLLAAEGLTADRVVTLARRLARADEAIERDVRLAEAAFAMNPRAFFVLPDEIAIRLLGRAVARAGDGTPVALGKLESLWAAMRGSEGVCRRTLAGAMITRDHNGITVEAAPPRRSSKGSKALAAAPLTKGRRSPRKRAKSL